MTVWLPAEEAYLRDLSALCATLSVRFKEEYHKYHRLESRFQIPAIIVSSALGLASFGNNQFPADTSRAINIAMGIVGLGLGVLNSIQSYLRIGPTMAGCLLASVSLARLKESIDLELALPVADRSASGIMFVRECSAQYEKIADAAPAILRRPRFVRALDNERLSTAASAPVMEGHEAVTVLLNPPQR